MIMSIHEVSYLKVNADIEIASIRSVLLCLSGNGGCAHVACLGSGSFFFVSFRKNSDYINP